MAESKQVMIDLETMGISSNAAICSIGAVKFTSEGIDPNTFYCTVDALDCKRLGLKVDASTVEWWKKQSKEAYAMLTKNTIPLLEAIDKFDAWFGSKSIPVWGCGSDFDNVILANAHKAVDRAVPWKYWDNRCYRTIMKTFPVSESSREGTYHNALDDAIHQTKHLLKILA